MRQWRFSCVLVPMLAGILAVAPAKAQGLDDDLRINGFVSQGYLNTDTVDYLIPNSVDGSAQFTEAAMTITATPTDRLRIAVQFLARTFGPSSSVTLDWGYGDYRWRDALGVRAGKVKLPYGFYNEVRDLDFLRTPVFLPQSIYNERFRELMTAYSGVGAYGNLSLRSAGGLDYHVYGGTLNSPTSDSGYWYETFSAGARTLEPLVEAGAEEVYPPGTAEAEFVEILDPQVTFPYIYGGALTWNTPWESLRLGTSVVKGKFNYDATFRYDVLMTDGTDPPRYYPVSLEYHEKSDIDRFLAFSGEYVHENLLVTSEYTEFRVNGESNEGWYVMADYRLFEPLSVAGIYSLYYEDKSNRDGSNFEEFGLPAHYGWQKDWTLAASYDITDHWLIKAEYHWMNGVALAQGGSLQDELVEPRPQYWHMFAAKTTFHF